MGELAEFHPGQSIELSDGRPATIRYVGNTHFAAGDWVGVELQDASGKNDGAVQGERYFDCPAGHGMFVRPPAIAVLNTPPTKPVSQAPTKANGTAPKSRPSSMVATGTKRQSLADPKATKRQSMNAPSPSPASRVSRLASPSKSPTKQLGSAPVSHTSSRTSTPSSIAPRKSMAPPAKPNRTSIGPPQPASSISRTSRPSIAGKLNGAAKPPSQISSSSQNAARRIAPGPKPESKIEPASSERESEKSEAALSPQNEEALVLSPTAQEPEDANTNDQRNSFASPVSEISNTSRSTRPVIDGRSPSIASQRPPLITPTLNREVEDLKAKLRVMEKKRAEDREKLKTVDRLQLDRDRFENIIDKLKQKIQPQQQELMDLRKSMKIEQEKVNNLESKLSEHDTLLEVATLDREMAEETAESVKIELDAIRQKYEEIELEVSVLREENDELGKEISPEEKTSQGWLQLERENLRLREALMRLRDVTQDREIDLNNQLKELEADSEELIKVKEEQRLTHETLDQSNATADELRQQLEITLGADDMIEELTDKNMTLNEKMEELNMTIEELESLRELNDELELNHVENEKQLQDEIDYHESLLAEEARKAAVQDGTIQDLEYTVSRFRELVANMQSDLEDMRASRQISETEATELNNRSRAMMDLNMKLQTSVSNTQVKALELELGKLEAQESMEHLSIVQLFLPDNFSSEQDSIYTLLRFKRLSFKSQMLYSMLKERLSPSSATKAEDDMSALCDVLDKLIWVRATCDRFIRQIQDCDVDKFKTIGAAGFEVDPIERSLNSWIEGLKRDELQYEQWATEMKRFIPLIDHLAEVHISDDLDHFPDQVLAHVAVMQSLLESTAGLVALFKSRLESHIPSPTEGAATDETDHFDTLESLDALVSQTRSGKVIVGKIARQLEDLQSRSLTLDPSTLSIVEHTQEAVESYAVSVRVSVAAVLHAWNDEMQEGDSVSAKISSALSSAPTSISSLTNKLQATTSQLQTFYNLTNNLAQTIEFDPSSSPPPWKALSQQIRDERKDSAAKELTSSRLKDELSEQKSNLAIKNKMLEELSVKNEVLEKRVGEIGGRRERIRELETLADDSKAKEKDFVAKLSRLRKEMEALEAEREEWKKAATAVPTQAHTVPAGDEPASSASALLHVDTLQAEIASLQSTIRYLRCAHQRTFSTTADAYLSIPLVPPVPSEHVTEHEACDVLKEMLQLISSTSASPVKLTRRPKEERLRWRPLKESSRWQVEGQKEEWAEWREWRDRVAQRSLVERREVSRQLGVKQGHEKPGHLAMPAKGGGGEVKVVGLDAEAGEVR